MSKLIVYSESTNLSRLVTEGIILHTNQLSIIIDWVYSQLGNISIDCIEPRYLVSEAKYDIHSTTMTFYTIRPIFIAPDEQNSMLIANLTKETISANDLQ